MVADLAVKKNSSYLKSFNEIAKNSAYKNKNISAVFSNFLWLFSRNDFS